MNANLDDQQSNGRTVASERLLIIEDNEVLSKILKDFLDHAGYELCEPSSEQLSEPEVLHALVREQAISLVVINLCSQSLDARQLFTTIRDQFPDLPMVALIAHMDQAGELLRSQEGDNYCLGLTDFIAKPYQPRAVVERVHTLLSNRRVAAFDEMLPRQNWIWFDANRLQVRIHVEEDQYEEAISLTPIEFMLMRHFVSHPYRIFSRKQLMRLLYADQRYVDDSVIDRHITNLGSKLRRVHPRGSMISKIGGVGYRFEKP